MAPRYTIVLLRDSTHLAGETLAPVFAQVCDALALAEDAGAGQGEREAANSVKTGSLS